MATPQLQDESEPSKRKERGRATHRYCNQIDCVSVRFRAGLRRSLHQRGVHKKSKLVLAANPAGQNGSGMHEKTNCIEMSIGGNRRSSSRGCCCTGCRIDRLGAAALPGHFDRGCATRLGDAALIISKTGRTKRRERHA